MRLTLDQKKKLINGWRTMPHVFLKSFFGIEVWSKQLEVLNAIRDNKRVAVKSGNTVGKSCIAAGAALWYLSLNRDSIVITTAPTWRQVEDVLWREIAGLYARRNQTIPLEGVVTKTKLEMGENWYAQGLSTDEPERFLGRHSKTGKLMVIMDEAYGIDPAIWESVQRLHPDKILAIGNPDSMEGQFYRCFLSPLWTKLTISCQECVDWQTANRRIPGLVNQEWIDEAKEEWGEKSPLYQSSVNGDFPTEGTDSLISIKWVDEARTRKNEEEENAMRIVAADVATKHGGAKTVVGYRVGHTFKSIDVHSQIPTTSTAGIIKRYYEDKQADTIVVDSDGIGCLTKGTEVFTNNGWQNVEAIKKGDIVYSKDKDDNLIESRVKSNRKIEGVGIIESDDYSFSFSHFIRCRSRQEYKKWQLRSWDDIYKKYAILDNSFKWIGKEKNFTVNANIRQMPNGGSYHTTKKNVVKAEWFARFLGWYISEGNLDNNNNRNDGIGISQSNKSRHVPDIKTVLSQCGFKHSVKESKAGELTFRIYNKVLYAWLKKNCYLDGRTAPFKKVPDWVKGNSSNVIRAFLDEFIKGDGYIHKGENTYYTSSVQLSDDLLELIYKTGKYGNKRKRQEKGSTAYINGRKITRKFDNYSIYEYKNKNICYDGRNKTFTHKKGDVWELKVDSPTTLFFVRFKDNRAFWVFNEGVSDILTAQRIGVLEFHGGYASKAIDKLRFKNLRSQFYWIVAKKFEKGLYDLSELPQKVFEQLKSQLCSIKVKAPDSQGRIQIETKEDMLARQILSPDIADYVVYSEYGFFMGAMSEIKSYSYR